MELETFVGKPVNPGEPVTSQGWNEIVNALASIVSFLKATAGGSLRVIIGNADADLASTRVVAIGPGGEVIDAAGPLGDANEFTLRGLPPGAYTIRAESPGFSPATTSVTLPTEVPVAMSMERSAPFMPLVFGQELQAALSEMSTLGIGTSRIVDITGREVPPANPGAEFGTTVVLAQLPSAGQPVPAGTTAQLVVSATLEIEATVEMPSLSGLSLTEVRRVLEELGLVLGDVRTRKS